MDPRAGGPNADAASTSLLGVDPSARDPSDDATAYARLCQLLLQKDVFGNGTADVADLSAQCLRYLLEERRQGDFEGGIRKDDFDIQPLQELYTVYVYVRRRTTTKPMIIIIII